MTISQLLLPGVRQVLIYGKKLVDGIPAELFAKKPFQDGKITALNHPAFQYGHLSLYPERICNLLGVSHPEVKTPLNFFELFKKGSICQHDSENNIYPDMQSITEYFFNSHEKILEILKDIPEASFYKTNQEEASKDRFDTVGSFVLYLLTAHANTHFGQVLAWRRCMGLAGV